MLTNLVKHTFQCRSTSFNKFILKSTYFQPDNLNFPPNCCFSGGGGTTMPGLLLLRAVYNHTKSRYRRFTVNSSVLNALELVYHLVKTSRNIYFCSDFIFSMTACDISYGCRVANSDMEGRRLSSLFKRHTQLSRDRGTLDS